MKFSPFDEPFIQIVLIFTIGIAIGNYLPSSSFALGAGIILAFLLSLSLLLLRKKRVLPYFILLTFLFLGASHLQNSNIVPSSDISHLTPGKYSLIGTIIKEPQIGKFKSKLILEAEKVLSSGKEKKVTGKVWVSTIYSRDSIKTLHYGDRVRLKNANLSKPSLPANPGEFNFRNWLARQKIYTAVNYITKKDSAGRERKIKVKVTDLEKIGEGKTNPLLKYSYLLKEKECQENKIG